MLETNFIDTEIGSVPKDWLVVRLGEISEFTTSTVFVDTIDKSWYIGTDNMISNKGGVTKNISNVPYLRVRGYKVNDILISNIRPYLKKIWIADRNGGCSSDVLVVRTYNEDVCLPSFLKVQLSSDGFFDFAMANAVGTKMPRGDKKVLVDYNFPLPSLPEQRRIASALTSIDGLISALDNLIRKKQAIKIGTMQELLSGKRRLEGFNKPWVNSRISDLYTVTRGYVLAMGNVRSIRSSAFPYPVYSSQTKNSGIAGYYSDYLYEDAITWTTDGANAGDMNFRKGLFYCTNVCGVLLSDSGMANYCMAKIIGLVSKSHVSYVGNPKLMNNTMSEIKIYHPSDVKEQLAISNLLQVMDDELAALEAKKAKYVALKQGMMQQLLTGKIRLIDSVLQNKQI